MCLPAAGLMHEGFKASVFIGYWKSAGPYETHPAVFAQEAEVGGAADCRSDLQRDSQNLTVCMKTWAGPKDTYDYRHVEEVSRSLHVIPLRIILRNLLLSRSSLVTNGAPITSVDPRSKHATVTVVFVNIFY